MFDENNRSDIENTSAVNTVVFEKSDKIKINENLSLSQEDVHAFMSNPQFLITYTLLDNKNFILNGKNLSNVLGIGVTEANFIIESMDAIGVIKKNEEGQYYGYPIHFENSTLNESDMLNFLQRNLKLSSSKVTSNDLYFFAFEIMSKSVVKKYEKKIQEIVIEMVNESKGKDDLAVYHTVNTITKFTKDIKV